jgi:hypothetical protein
LAQKVDKGFHRVKPIQGELDKSSGTNGLIGNGMGNGKAFQFEVVNVGMAGLVVSRARFQFFAFDSREVFLK